MVNLQMNNDFIIMRATLPQDGGKIRSTSSAKKFG
jgi:hypothetical protein